MVLFGEAQHGVCLQENFAKQRQSWSKLCWSIQFIYMEDLRRKKNTTKYSEISSWHGFDGSGELAEDDLTAIYVCGGHIKSIWFSERPDQTSLIRAKTPLQIFLCKVVHDEVFCTQGTVLPMFHCREIRLKHSPPSWSSGCAMPASDCISDVCIT